MPRCFMPAVLWALGLLPVSAIAVAATGEFYCCQDAANRRICGDTLPEQCRGRAYRVLDAAGNVIKDVGPPLTPEQRAEQALENHRRKLQDEAEREQRRRDQALLDTYASLDDIDMAQKKAEADVNLAMRETQERMEVARRKQKKLAEEAEFYRKRAMPPELEKELRAVTHELKLKQELLTLKRHDLAAVKAKYDGERQRYLELTGRRGPAGPSPR